MINKMILLVTVLSYSVVASQSFMYVLALKNTQLGLNGGTYTEVRRLIDANMKTVLTYVICLALLAQIALLVANVKNPASLLFVSACIAFVALVADVVLTLKGSMPLNALINGWSPKNYPANWMEIRQQWFTVFRYRQIVTITGFIALLAGAVFGDK